MKSKSQSTKWGFWDITDEQAEKINQGDGEELYNFFMRNYQVIEKMCGLKLRQLSGSYHSDVDLCEIINAYYYDLHFAKFESGALLSNLLYYSASAVERSSYKIAEKLSPITLFASYNNSPMFQPLVYQNASGDDKEDFCIADLFETALSPQDEIDEEKKIENFSHLVSSLLPLVPSSVAEYLPFYLNGIRPAHASQRLGAKYDNGSAMYKKIENSLVVNYSKVLEILSENGYIIPSYLLDVTPSKYVELSEAEMKRQEKKLQKQAEKERKRQEAEAKKARKAQERAERAKHRKERLREYNREYKRRQRAQAKLASVSETA